MTPTSGDVSANIRSDSPKSLHVRLEQSSQSDRLARSLRSAAGYTLRSAYSVSRRLSTRAYTLKHSIWS